KPGRWTPEIVISRHNGLYGNLKQEVQHAQLVNILGAERARELLNLHPGRPELKPDAALDLSFISAAVIERYTDSRAAVQFRPEDVGPEFRANATNLEFRRQAFGAVTTADASPENAVPGSDTLAEGSNNWVISGARTFAGGAIMANDPHRPM